MSKIPLLCILFVLLVISIEVDARKRPNRNRGGRGPSKQDRRRGGGGGSHSKEESSEEKDGRPEKRRGGGSHSDEESSEEKDRRPDKRRGGGGHSDEKSSEVQDNRGKHKGSSAGKYRRRKCQCNEVVDLTPVRCRKNKRKCNRRLWFKKTTCDYPWTENDKGGTDTGTGTTKGPGTDSGSGTTKGSGTDTGTGTTKGTGTGTNDDTGNDGSGGLTPDGGSDPNNGTDVDIIVLNPDGTETPDYVNQKCADAIGDHSGESLFYLESASPVHFIQCDEFGNSFLLPCAPNTVWCQLKLTCDHDDASCNAK